jgi:large subunit ribosomal protein L21
MYAIVDINGVQTKVTPDEVLEVNALTGDPGAKLTFDKVLLVGNGEKISVGQPAIKGASVAVEILEHLRGPKLRIFKFKRRREYRRRKGHRDALTRIRVTAITAK